MKKIFIGIYMVSLIFLIHSCKNNNGYKTEKYQKNRNKIINVSNNIVDIKPKILFGNSLFYIIDSILIVNEVSPKGEKGIHLFNKNNFEYITSAGIIGKGPGEISIPGRIGIDYKSKILWVPDHGKKVMWKFPLDSILKNEAYRPTESIKLQGDLFLDRFNFLNDSIAIGKAVQPVGNSSYSMVTAKQNFSSKVINKFGYEHPKAVGKKSNSVFTLSLKNGIYINCYYYCDLLTINSLDGKLKYNIYGVDEMDNRNYKKAYYFGVDVMSNFIVASYIDEEGLIYDGNRPKGNTPSKFLIFDTNGNYIKTIETGYKFTYFCIDEENKRLIVYFDSRENPLGYFNLPID
jgi:hypothetical protein